MTALMLAKCDSILEDYICNASCECGIAKALINEGKADVNLTDNDGETALMMASRRGCSVLVSALLKAPNANTNLANKDGKTAFMIACEEETYDVVATFIKLRKVDVRRLCVRP